MNFKKLDALLEGQPKRGIPFCEMIITKDGETVYHKWVGTADAEGKVPYTPEHLCWIFSCTKVITCVAAMQLVEQGRLSLSDPVSKYLPTFASLSVLQKDQTVAPAKREMTVEHLFTMTGGLDYDLKRPAVAKAIEEGRDSTLEIASELAKDPLLFEPGSHYRYSLCHDVLAAVVEIVSGERFADYLQKHIFDPLGVTDTGFRLSEEQKTRLCSSFKYEISTGTSTPLEADNAYAFSDHYDSGGAGLFSRPSEYVKVLSALACNGTAKNGYQLLKPETLAMMEENRLAPTPLRDFISHNTGRHYGYGWGLCGRVHTNPDYSMSASSKGEFGWDGAAGAFTMVDRAKGIAVYYAQQVRACAYVYNRIHPLLRNLTVEALED